MPRTKFKEGDFVEIPLPDGRVAIGWILHLSKHFKNAVGFVVFGIKGQASDKVTVDPESGQPTSIEILGPLYTHVAAIKHYGWTTYAHAPLDERGRLLTKRIVGGGVYIEDEYLGSVAELGEHDLPHMLAMGMPRVYLEIEEAFGKGELPDSSDESR